MSILRKIYITLKENDMEFYIQRYTQPFTGFHDMEHYIQHYTKPFIGPNDMEHRKQQNIIYNTPQASTFST